MQRARLLFAVGICHRSASDILFWWSVVSLAEIHKYPKQLLLDFTESTSNPWRPPSSGSWCMMCCKCKKDCWTCVSFQQKSCLQKICTGYSRALLSRVRRRWMTLWLVSVRLSYCPHCMYIYAGFVRYLQGQNYQQWYLASTFTWF
jgi:hypothetical protein